MKEEFEINGHYKKVGEILKGNQKRKGILIHVLQDLQQRYNYLPAEHLKKLSERLGIPLSEIYSTATFYKLFHFAPRGKNILSVCVGTACHVRGSSKILQQLKNEFGVNEGETTPDRLLTLETVGCIGCCGLAPVAVVNDEAIGDVDFEKTSEIIRRIKWVKNGRAEIREIEEHRRP